MLKSLLLLFKNNLKYFPYESDKLVETLLPPLRSLNFDNIEAVLVTNALWLALVLLTHQLIDE